MKVVVDRGKCIASGMCTTIAPAVFRLDGNDKLVVLQQDVADDAINVVGDAVACCPVEALSLIE